MERAVVGLLILSVSLRSATCAFLHEPSAVFLKPGGDPNPKRDFGFSMGHWYEQLIVGSPNSDSLGEVYSCPIASVSDDTEITCSTLNLKANATRFMTTTFHPNQHFYLGASISTTEKYFFTCAPLMTKRIRRQTNILLDAFGSCYMYFQNGTVIPYKGPDYRYIKGINLNSTRIEGGFGWSTLADEINGYLITSKPSIVGDINYSYISDLRSVLTSYAESDVTVFDPYSNIGYGLAAGTFFSNKTVYAFSVKTINMKGEILFLEPQGSDLVMLPNKITHQPVNAMFGYTMAAADLNQDGKSELLVGAPALSDDGAVVEYGALYIYKGGDPETCDEKNRIRTIFGEAGRGRFGTAVAAGDIDGDNIPEVFVSAPHEDTGVVYVLSGFELKSLLSSATFMQKRVSELQLTQRLSRRDVSQFGFSLQVVPDVDGNGCDELAVGSPGAALVVLYRGLQSVNVTIFSHVVGSQFVREKVKKMTVNVCLNFSFRSNTSNVTGSVFGTNYIKGKNVYIVNPEFTVDLKEKPEKICKEIIVKFTQQENGVYTFTTKLELLNLNSTLNSKGFDNSWVVLSPYNETKYTFDIERRCEGIDCDPNLTMEIQWPGPKNYTLGSSSAETVTITVTNHGFRAERACVWISVSGALIARAGCDPKAGGLECLLEPLGREDKYHLKIVLNMTKLSNEDTALNLVARLQENCGQEIKKTESLNIPYHLELEKKLVYLGGTTHNLEITEKDVFDENVGKLKHEHEYSITNNGSITWKNIRATILVQKKPFIVGVGSTGTNCARFDDDDQEFKVNCHLTLAAGSINKIIVWVEMSKKQVGKYLHKEKEINELSKMILSLDPTDYNIDKELITIIKWKTDMTFGTNKLLISLVAGLLALLLLAIIFFILLKNGFFKRKEKKRLDVLRESVRRRSIRLGSERRHSRHPDSVADDDLRLRSERKQSRHPDSIAEDELVDVQELEDSAFEDSPAGRSDGAVLIESAAHVHKHEERKNK